eukprot:scaffold72486_cov18-Tisochrysis_lutea.AAC.1
MVSLRPSTPSAAAATGPAPLCAPSSSAKTATLGGVCGGCRGAGGGGAGATSTPASVGGTTGPKPCAC